MSAAWRLANPHRIKAAHRRRWKCSTGHTLYANDNPYRYTDPDGRQEADVSEEDVESFRQMMQPNLVPVAPQAEGGSLPTAPDALGEIQSRGDAASAKMEETVKTFTTYTRTNKEGTVYSGKTSGKGTPEQQVKARTNAPDHQEKTNQGYGPAVVDKNSSSSDAIRGREQQLIEKNGGAQSQGGSSGNKINGVSPSNPKAGEYQKACTKEFGCG